MADLGAHDCLRAGRQRRVAHHAPLVVVDVARLLVGRERVALPLHRQHQVGLLDHLRGIKPHIRLVHQQRIGGVGLEIPLRERGKALALLMDTQPLVVGDIDRGGRIAPAGHFFGGHTQLSCLIGIADAGIGSGDQVVCRHQVREDVVADDRGVLVGTGDPVEVPGAVAVVVPERHPQPGGLDQHGKATVLFERLIAGHDAVALEGHRDVGVDVPGRGTRRPVGRALLSADGPPRESGTLEAEFGRPLPGEVQCRGPPAQRVGYRVRQGVGQHREHETFGVPEGVAVVAGPGESLAGDRASFGARTGLHQVKEPEPHGLLGFRVAFDLDVRVLPEVVEVLALRVQQRFPPAVARAVQCRGGLVAQCRSGAQTRPAIGDVFDDAQLLSRAQPADHCRPRQVRAGIGGELHSPRHVDFVVHRGGHHQRAGPGPVHEKCSGFRVFVVDGFQRVVQDGRDPRVGRGLWLVLVGDELGLHGHADEFLDGLDAVLDGRDTALGQRHQPGGRHFDLLARRRAPVGVAGQRPGAHVEDALVGEQFAVPDVERLVAD